MSALSVQLNTFNVGASQVGASQIYPIHKRLAEESLSKIFDQYLPADSNKTIPLRLQFRPGLATLVVGDQEVVLPETEELKKVRGAVRHYQNAGLLSKRVGTPKEEATLAQQTKKTVRVVNAAGVPGTNGNLLAGMRVADDTLSLTRNIMYAVPILGQDNAIAHHLGYYAGLFWSFFALRELDDGFSDYKRSKVIGDLEGKERAISRIFSGSIVSGASLSYLGGKICDTFISSGVASSVLGVSNVLFGAGSLLSAGTNLVSVVRCHRFSKRLNEYLENSALSEQQKMRGAVQFLKDSISVTVEEMGDVQAEIEAKHPDWTAERKEQLLQQRIADLTEVKVKRMKRRTSNESLRSIFNSADQILNKLDSPSLVNEGIRDAALLIDQVQKSNRVKKNLFVLGLIASLVSVVAMAILSFMSAGALPFVLYGISGTIYLAMTIYMTVGLLLNRRCPPELEMEAKVEGEKSEMLS